MTRFRKLTTGVMSLLPFPMLAAVITLIFVRPDQYVGRGLEFLPHIAYYTTCILLIVYFTVDLFTNPNVRPDRRLLWIVVLLLGNVFVFPVYWYLFIWRDTPLETAPAQKTYCRWCGYEYEYPVEECVNCGRSMAGGAFVCTLNYGRVGAFLPYRNRGALWGYYAGVFSFVPAAGLALGPAAVLLGIKGLRAFREGPDNLGRGHAIAAIILGALGSMLNLAAGACVYYYLAY